MARYLISFDDGAMTFPEKDLPEVAEAAHRLVWKANAPVYGSLANWTVRIAAAGQCAQELMPDLDS